MTATRSSATPCPATTCPGRTGTLRPRRRCTPTPRRTAPPAGTPSTTSTKPRQSRPSATATTPACRTGSPSTAGWRCPTTTPPAPLGRDGQWPAAARSPPAATGGDDERHGRTRRQCRTWPRRRSPRRRPGAAQDPAAVAAVRHLHLPCGQPDVACRGPVTRPRRPGPHRGFVHHLPRDVAVRRPATGRPAGDLPGLPRPLRHRRPADRRAAVGIRRRRPAHTRSALNRPVIYTGPCSASDLICRGFHDRYDTAALQIVGRLWGFVDVDPPTPDQR